MCSQAAACRADFCGLQDGEVEFGAVNCDKQSELCGRFGIQSFPKFLLFGARVEWNEEYPKQRLKELGPQPRLNSQGWLKIWANFRPLTGIFRQIAGPT
jgi:hypothetical protein